MNRYPFPNYEGQFISPICGFTWTCIIVWRTVPTTLSVREQEIPDKGPAVLSRAAPAASRLFFSVYGRQLVCASPSLNVTYPSHMYTTPTFIFSFSLGLPQIAFVLYCSRSLRTIFLMRHVFFLFPLSLKELRSVKHYCIRLLLSGAMVLITLFFFFLHLYSTRCMLPILWYV